MKGFGLVPAGAIALLLGSSALASPPTAIMPALAGQDGSTASLPDRGQVLALLDRAATTQIAALTAQGLDLPTANRQITPNWISATFLIGLGRLTRVSDASGGRRYLRDVAEHYNFGLLGGWSAHNMLDADNLAIGEVYQELYARSGEAGEIAPLRARLDYTGQYLGLDPAPKRLVWWWADAMFMAPPVFARAAAQLHDHSYLTAMDAGWWRTYDRLWSAEHHLYYRDERFIDRRSRNGKPVFWARGNGWVVAGLARVLDTMPAKFPTRQRYVDTFTAMTAALAPLQRTEDGLWTASLLDPTDPAGPETTGSAFFTYAMAWGINHGLLDRATYLPRVQRAWAGLTGKIQPNGLLGYAQRAGDQPVPSAATDQALYGTGALLLAGLEVMELGKPVTTLPVPEPRPDPAGPLRLPIALTPRPTDPARIAGWERAMAERQAMIDLAYDPATQTPTAAAPTGSAGVTMPRITLPLTPPPPDQRAARASVSYAPYRFDDILWENDRTAHRIYGPALQREEPPSSSAIDAWGKNVPWPFMERQLRTGKQHDYHGEGIDFYNAGTTRGAGGLGIWHDDKLWVSRNWATYRILKNGPDVADFTVDYAPWPVDVVRKVWETRRFTLPIGTNFTRLTSTLHSDRAGPLVVGIGIQKKPTATTLGTFTADRARGRFSMWTPTDADKGAMGVAVMVDPRMIADVVEDADNYIVLVNVTPDKPFVYYMGATWSKSRDFHDRAAWERYVTAQTPDFVPPRP
jgi:rhamnogalacturonyl hydrolase YesR